VVYHLRGKSDICCQLLVLTIIHDLFGVDNMLHIHRVVVCIAQCTFCFTWWLNMSILSSCAMICLIKAVSFRFSYSIFMHMHFGILLKPPAVYFNSGNNIIAFSDAQVFFDVFFPVVCCSHCLVCFHQPKRIYKLQMPSPVCLVLLVTNAACLVFLYWNATKGSLVGSLDNVIAIYRPLNS
jgi:hypothetical protein